MRIAISRLRLLALALLLLSWGASLHAQQTVGLFQYDAGATDGYTLLGSLSSTNTYLIDNCGRKVHEWASAYTMGTVAYLLPDGHLLRTGRTTNPAFPMGGLSGHVELLDWAGNVDWDYTVSTSTEAQHHDAIQLPNGNILMVVWVAKDSLDAVAEGRNPAILGPQLWSEKLIEVQPTTPGNGNIVWEWHVWDHLVQEFDNTKPNFAVVADHPELIHLNYYDPTSEVNWLHINGLSYNAERDEIAISSHRFDEIWVIDHSTTTAQAASHTGGNRGKGGDLLYRYGNPQTYNRGTVNDQRFFGQHNIQWVPAGDSHAGKLAVFNNGFARPDGAYSVLEIFNPPIDAFGNYVLTTGQPYGPATSDWTYQDTANFYSQIISGLQRLPHDHTLVCEGTSGHIFELDSLSNVVWSYVNPIVATGPLSQGDSVANNFVFRAYRYAADFPGLTGQTLMPTDPLEGNPLPLPSICLGSGQADADVAELGVFPNPTHDRITVERVTAAPAWLSVRDLHGRLLLRTQVRGKSADLDLSSLPQGVYLLMDEAVAVATRVVKM